MKKPNIEEFLKKYNIESVSGVGLVAMVMQAKEAFDDYMEENPRSREKIQKLIEESE